LVYHQLWQENQPPLEALRQAQLALYRNPQDMARLARQRGPDFDTTVRRLTQPPKRNGPQPGARAAVRDWAAFVLSGAGRCGRPGRRRGSLPRPQAQELKAVAWFANGVAVKNRRDREGRFDVTRREDPVLLTQQRVQARLLEWHFAYSLAVSFAHRGQ